jgi:hypothetical protein
MMLIICACDWAEGMDGRASLNSYQRVEVALGIARGLDYLHSFAV